MLCGMHAAALECTLVCMTNKTRFNGTVAVIGAGFAGLTIARALVLEGWQVDVYDLAGSSEMSASHANHLTAGMMPVASSDLNITSQLSRLGCMEAERFWQALPQQIGERCGAIQLQRQTGRQADLKQVVARIAALTEGQGWVPDWVRNVDADEASALSGQCLKRGGLFFAGAWCVKPAALLTSLAATDGIKIVHRYITKIEYRQHAWFLSQAHLSDLGPYSAVVLANGFDAKRLLIDSQLMTTENRLQQMYALAGEVTYLPAEQIGGGPRCIVAGDGYVLPASEGWCTVGGTYAQNATVARCEPGGVTMNVKRAAELLDRPALMDDMANERLPGWAGWRAVLPNRLPVIGPISAEKGLWVASGLASRGLTWSVLAAKQIVTGLSGRPNPLPNYLLRAILPT